MALAKKLGLVDHTVASNAAALDEILKSRKARAARRASIARAWARRACWRSRARGSGAVWRFVGEGNDVKFDVSPDLIHPQITIYGSWVTSLGTCRS